MQQNKYLRYLGLPAMFNVARTKEILKVNPTAPPERPEPESVTAFVFDYNAEGVEERELPSLQDLYINNVNLRLNEVMKVMAIVTCLLAPATVIGGIFGMNFESIPLLHNRWGFFISVALMLLIPIWMLRAFKNKGWF